MSVDVTFRTQEKVCCPHCGFVVSTEDSGVAECSGRGWYPLLEELGYYVPWDQRTEENNWYGKDMELTPEQTLAAHRFIKKHPDLYGGDEARALLADALLEDLVVTINADW